MTGQATLVFVLAALTAPHSPPATSFYCTTNRGLVFLDSNGRETLLSRNNDDPLVSERGTVAQVGSGWIEIFHGKSRLYRRRVRATAGIRPRVGAVSWYGEHLLLDWNGRTMELDPSRARIGVSPDFPRSEPPLYAAKLPQGRVFVQGQSDRLIVKLAGVPKAASWQERFESEEGIGEGEICLAGGRWLVVWGGSTPAGRLVMIVDLKSRTRRKIPMDFESMCPGASPGVMIGAQIETDDRPGGHDPQSAKTVLRRVDLATGHVSRMFAVPGIRTVVGVSKDGRIVFTLRESGAVGPSFLIATDVRTRAERTLSKHVYLAAMAS